MENENKFEMWKRDFEEDFRNQQIKIDNLFSEIIKLKERIDKLEKEKK